MELPYQCFRPAARLDNSPLNATRLTTIKAPAIIMIVPPSSRRLRVFGGVAILTLIATYIHIRSQWDESSFGYARGYYKSVTSYFGSSVYNNTLYSEGNEETVNQYYNASNPCANFPDTDGILLVMKTGATETFDKMPVHLLTTMNCLPDFLIFSDMVRCLISYFPF